MIKEVIFDIDNTLYDYEIGHAEGMKQLDQYVWEHFQVEPEEFHSTYKRLQKECLARLGRDNAATHSRSIRLQNMLEQWGQPIFPHLKNMYQLYWDSFFRCSRPEPGSVECLKALREMGITIGIGTDMTARMQYEKLEVFGFAPYINHMVTSQEAGAEKPSRSFMELCLKKSGLAPRECLFVGDNFSRDIVGAVNVDMYAVWYNPKQNALPKNPELLEDSYYEIHHFDQLIPYIKTIK